jgi:hypothetical protein
MRAAISNQFVAPQIGTETASATKPHRGMARHLMDVVTHCCFQDMIRLRSLKIMCVCVRVCVRFCVYAWGNLWRDIDLISGTKNQPIDEGLRSTCWVKCSLRRRLHQDDAP